MEWLQSFFSVPEGSSQLMLLLIIIRRIIAFIGVLVILWGAFEAFILFIRECHLRKNFNILDTIRLKFGRMIVLGLEFIVAADVIETTTAPDYYTLGILASLVAIRSFLTFFMNNEIRAASKIGRK